MSNIIDILIVEDDLAFLEVLNVAIIKSFDKSLCVVAESDGDKALEILKTNTVKVLVTDLQLRCATNGEELIEYVHTNNSKTLVVVVSGSRFLSNGKVHRVYDFLKKPVNLEYLCSVVRSALHLGQEETQVLKKLSIALEEAESALSESLQGIHSTVKDLFKNSKGA